MNDEPLPRKLTAILYADVAGYSRLTGEDEEGTHRRLSRYLDLIGTAVGNHSGRVVHYAGDAVLADFPTVTDALVCATKIQDDLASENASLPEERKVKFRIGVNLGEVIVDRDDIYGDGVNVAARLEGLAESGGICVSESVYTAIGNKLPLKYQYLGEKRVKNIERRVRAYHARAESDAGLTAPSAAVTARARRPGRAMGIPLMVTALVIVGAIVGIIAWQEFSTPAQDPASVENMTLPLPEKPSIAVLPFDNLTGDSDQEPFVDAFTEDIITELSHIENLFVIDRHSSFAYKGKSMKMKQIAEQLGVRYVLEGSVQRSGDRVRVTAQLIDALSGDHRWAERYDRKLTDLFALFDDLTWKIATAMEIELTAGYEAQRDRERTHNHAAYQHLARGKQLFRRFTEEDNHLARQEFEIALELDPDSEVIIGWLGWTHWEDRRRHWSESPSASLEMAEQLARRALAIKEDSSMGHTLLANVYLANRSFDTALEEIGHATALAPGLPDVHALKGMILTVVGRPEEAIEELRHAMRLSPFYPAWYLSRLGDAYRLKGDYEQAIELLEKAKERSPETVSNRVRLIAALVAANRLDEARAEGIELLRVKPSFTIENYAKTLLYKDMAVVEQMTNALRMAGLPEKAAPA